MTRPDRAPVSSPAGDPYDVVVIGGGAAGLSGALTLARARRRVRVIDSGTPRNAPAKGVHGFLGLDGIAPRDLIARGRDEVTGYGGEVVAGEVVTARRTEEGFAVGLADGTSLTARRLLVATGLVDQLPDVPGVAERFGRDVLHCPYCHGWEVRDREIGVLATGPRATHQALLFRQWSDRVRLLANGQEITEEDRTALAARGIAVIDGTVEAIEVSGDRLVGARLGDGTVEHLEALVVAPRFVARTEALAGLGLGPVEHAAGTGLHLTADAAGRTGVPGVWVAGNATNLAGQVVAAAAEGTWAAAQINADLVAEDTARAVEALRATAANRAPATD
jgi:thioredoxin reductase